MTESSDLEKQAIQLWKIIFCSLGIFIISLTQTAFTTQDYSEKIQNTPSYLLFLTGGFAFLGGGLLESITWLANPLYIISIFLFLYKKRSSRVISLIAAGLALSFSFWNSILASESGREDEIIAKNAGYWLWLSSILIVTFGTRYYFARAEKKRLPLR